jgi:putative colanic acid biosynthesis acetyltransferase WcaF
LIVSSIKIFIAGLLNYLWNNVVTHVPLHFVRRGFLRIFNKNISSSCTLLLHARILNFWSLEVGDRSVINQYVLVDCRKYKVKISHDVDIGPYTKIWTLAHDPDSDSHPVVGGDVAIEDHVWIASSATILPGVTLGRGCVVGSSSLVTKDVPSLEVWGGVPAKFLKTRNNSLTYRLNYTPYFE